MSDIITIKNAKASVDFHNRRTALGLKTRADVADKMGVSVEAVRSWETASRPVPKYALKMLALLEKKTTRKK